MIYKFYKEQDGSWFVDLPHYIEEGYGTQADLAMVAGADTFLDSLNWIKEYEEKDRAFVEVEREGDGKVKLDIVLEPNTGYQVLQFIENGWYVELKTGHLMWLCEVTIWLFGEYPKFIYFKKVN